MVARFQFSFDGEVGLVVRLPMVGLPLASPLIPTDVTGPERESKRRNGARSAGENAPSGGAQRGPPSMQLCDQFRALVDRSIARMPALTVPAIDARYADRFEGVQPGSRYTALYELISELLKSSSGIGLAQFRDMRRALRYQSIAGLATDPYYQIAHFIQDACRQGFLRSFGDEATWLEAIDAARSCVVLHRALPDRDLRLAAVTDAALRLIAAGYPVCVKEDHLHLEPDQLDRLCADIEGDIRVLGGGIVLLQIFAFFRDAQLYQFGRYIPGRTFGYAPRLPSLPVGYLLNLGVKHLTSAPIRNKNAVAQIWSRVAERARDLCALYDIEPYHYIENIILPPRELPHYLSSVALFDHLFVLRQWPPTDMGTLLRGILDFVDYIQPQDADKSDFWFKPFVEIHRNSLLLISPSLAALGFFEAVTCALRGASYPRLEQQMGDAIERSVASTFRTHGLDVTIEGKTYTMFDPQTGTQQKGECDVVVETPENVVFVETKKKPHRRVSATGDALANLIDLSGSLFDAQAQLARHERILLHHGHIQFDDGKRLECKGRSIERIAITLLDYGSLQDKYLLSQLFEALAGVSIKASGVNAAAAKKLAELNESVALLRKEIEELGKLGHQGNQLFFNCWFFSMPQLVLLLDGINDPSAFRDRLNRLKHLTFHTLDFYRDFGLARRGKLV